MKTASIISNEMTLEEKLAAIDQAMAEMQAQADEEAGPRGISAMQLDSAELTLCEGCQ